MTTSETLRHAFRCTVVPENSAACLTIGWRQHKVRVIDTSREAFTLEVNPNTFAKVTEGSRAVLDYNDESWEVQCIALFQMLNGQLNVSMARIRECSKIRGPRATFWSLLPMANATRDPVLPLALLLSLLFACVALPGMGDSIGTAPKIRKAVQDVWRKTLGD
jgi:hypothetical protein